MGNCNNGTHFAHFSRGLSESKSGKDDGEDLKANKTAEDKRRCILEAPVTLTKVDACVDVVTLPAAEGAFGKEPASGGQGPIRVTRLAPSQRLPRSPGNAKRSIWMREARVGTRKINTQGRLQ